jgi:hypothetical protein
VRGWLIDRIQWTAIVAVMLVQEIVVGLIGHALRQGWYVVKEKVAFEWRRRW